jgi:hypothetical protein
MIKNWIISELIITIYRQHETIDEKQTKYTASMWITCTSHIPIHEKTSQL